MRAATQHFLFSGVEEILSQYLFFASPFKMATTFFKRLAKATPIVFSNAFGCQSSSTFTVPFGAMAALSGGISFFYYFSSPTVVHLDQINEHPGPKIALNSDKWIEFKLQDTARVSHNTQLFRFSFDPTAKLGLDIASCILTRAPMAQDTEGKTKYIIRPYTPISDPDAKGYFDFLIKVYPEGKMSQHFASLKPGNVVEVKGPIEKLRYSPNMNKHIGMIAGGSGITPMLKVVEAILKNQDDDTQVSLLYANVSPDDILLKQKLDSLAVSHPNFKVFYTVDNPSKNWRGGAGYISKDMVVKGLPSPSDDTLILVCGPPGMMKHVSGDKAEDRSQGEVLNSIYCDPFGFKGLHLNWNCITCYVH
ncbi:NADH-cytochrome b5 reductase-like protein isoform X2 [Tripterygium wilfordii]|uniref:NADH-cytochrome b5 reductase-like protein isoform X2 n=1 Tax=Tripterygium wilfordii TaxID=458696 RepID=UPI0018F830CB|nr:NADH-cytochrome b5 reductase-like protein isoform X2 [Tripterygium wilfordii]